MLILKSNEAVKSKLRDLGLGEVDLDSDNVMTSHTLMVHV